MIKNRRIGHIGIATNDVERDVPVSYTHLQQRNETAYQYWKQ